MKIEITIDEADLWKQVQSLVTEGVRRYLTTQYGEPTSAGQRVVDQAVLQVGQAIASGEVRKQIAEAAAAEQANVIKELTVKTMRTMVRKELKEMKERGQLTVKGLEE